MQTGIGMGPRDQAEAAKSESLPEIQRGFEAIEKAIACLRDNVGRLEQRLEMVLDSTPRTEKALSPPEVEIPATAMGKTLNEFRLAIDAQTNRLGSIGSRLGL